MGRPYSQTTLDLAAEVLRQFAPPPELSPSQWAEQSVYIPVGNALPGLINFDNAPYQREPLDMTANPDCYRITLKWGAQVGKAVSLDTVLPTPRGLRRMAEIEAGDWVFDEAGMPTMVLLATPPMLNRDCFEVSFDDGESVICDREHLWTVVDRGHKIRGVSTNREITLTVGEMLEPHHRSRAQGRNRYSIPNCQPLNFQKQSLPIDPYVYGCWLGDGIVGSGQIVTHVSDSWMAKEFSRRKYDVVGRAKDKRAPDTVYWRLKCQQSGLPLATILTKENLRKKTRIDARYLTASISQRRDLLAGLMDTDGYSDDRGNSEFITMHEGLADAVTHLASSLGIKPRKTRIEKSCIYKGKRRVGTYWSVRFRAYTKDLAFLLPRKRSRVEAADRGKKYLRVTESRERRIVEIKAIPSVPVKCIMVASPRSLYLVGRGCIPTHNTTLALCAQGYRISENPSSQMMMQPSEGDLQTWLETKFNPMAEANPALSDKLAKPRGREGVNNQKMKSYPGGFIMFSWSGSPRTMRGRSAPFIVADEVDGYVRTSEGHPVSLLWQRAATFGDQRMLMEISTPTTKGASYIDTSFEAGDQRRFHVPCPDCGHQQHLKWSSVTWQSDDDGELLPATVRYACEGCGSLWTDAQRIRAIRGAESQGGGWRAAKPFRGHASYHLNELYSTLVRLADVVQSFLDKKKNNDLQTFVNVSLAEVWEEQGAKVDSEALMLRAESFKAEVPAGGVYLTAGIDMQMDRLEIETVAWGVGEESWSVDYTVLWGDPLQQDVWDDLDDHLARVYVHESGSLLPVSSACLDTGGTSGFTQAAYEYAKDKIAKHLFAIKGVGGWGRPIVTAPSRKRTGRKQRPVSLFTVGVDEAKVMVAKRLGILEPGPGYCHFPASRDAEWFHQITAEKLITRYVRGFPFREWHKTRERNEATDCRVYAFAALKITNPNLKRLAERMKKQDDNHETETPEPTEAPKPGKMVAERPEKPPEEKRKKESQTKTIKKVSRPRAARKVSRARKGWVNRW